jgi:nuclear mRNA export protein SAC3
MEISRYFNVYIQCGHQQLLLLLLGTVEVADCLLLCGCRCLLQVLGTCTDMCPALERIKRIDEFDVHKLEFPFTVLPTTLHAVTHEQLFASTMIKRFQRSSADHDLLIADMLRTPETLLRTIEYIETQVMNKYNEGVDPRLGETPSKLMVYLFIWDRFRMVAKDFTLQQYSLSISDIWVECHERMARWFIFMDHDMKSEGELSCSLISLHLPTL